MIKTVDELFDIDKNIKGLNEEYMSLAKKRWDSLSKPIDGFGDFEDVLCKIAGIKGETVPDLKKKALMVFCADNGIVEEGVSQTDSSVTAQVARKLGMGVSTVNFLAGKASVDVYPVDVGIAFDESLSGVSDKKVAMGTENFLKIPAMTKEQALSAIKAGMETVYELSDKGYDMLLTGEMGIGNTTTSTAILCALTGFDPAEFTGRGAGLSDEGLKIKTEVIKKGLQKYRDCIENESDKNRRAFEILRCLGGYDMAALTGAFIGAAIKRIPIITDGLVCTVAALVAENLAPGTKDFIIASHRGREKGNINALKILGLKPLIDGDMALGEGTGAVMASDLIDMIHDYYKNGKTF
ncbi:MAG: nicotinate-nucleotide--dimethylbenzimidazole phosphoribosyltransferase, partial [Lachnospiraceae bacterium]|nr:nicotinate-nucleotide--dimethylbenzimidazole phosphoribosyltransferase [Lachnospiraceae bacterium]